MVRSTTPSKHGGGSSENLIGSNHFLRDHEPWTPFLGVGNDRDDTFGLVNVSGAANSIIGNSAYAAQVDALLTTEAEEPLAVTSVLVEAGSVRNTVLDSGTDGELVVDRSANAVRPTPAIGG